MRRGLVLGLTVVMFSSCAMYRAIQPAQARFEGLQNPAYRGDANKDLVPYQARERDLVDCRRSKGMDAEIDAQLDQAFASSRHTSRWESMKDPAIWDAAFKPIFDCLAARGWR